MSSLVKEKQFLLKIAVRSSESVCIRQKQFLTCGEDCVHKAVILFTCIHSNIHGTYKERGGSQTLIYLD